MRLQDELCMSQDELQHEAIMPRCEGCGDPCFDELIAVEDRDDSVGYAQWLYLCPTCVMEGR